MGGICLTGYVSKGQICVFPDRTEVCGGPALETAQNAVRIFQRHFSLSRTFL